MAKSVFNLLCSCLKQSIFHDRVIETLALVIFYGVATSYASCCDLNKHIFTLPSENESYCKHADVLHFFIFIFLFISVLLLLPHHQQQHQRDGFMKNLKAAGAAMHSNTAHVFSNQPEAQHLRLHVSIYGCSRCDPKTPYVSVHFLHTGINIPGKISIDCFVIMDRLILFAFFM